MGDRVKRFALCYRTVICLSVLSCLFCLKRWCIVAIRLDGSRINLACNDASRPRPWPHCVRWGPRSTSPKGAQPPISAHICSGQMARWIKMPLGTKIGLGPGRSVLHWHPAPPFKRDTTPQFSADVCYGQTVANLSYCGALVYIHIFAVLLPEIMSSAACGCCVLLTLCVLVIFVRLTCILCSGFYTADTSTSVLLDCTSSSSRRCRNI